MNNHSLVIFNKYEGGWSITSNGGICIHIAGFSTKAHAEYTWSIIKIAYQQGREAEFKDNNNKTDTLMERFGI